MTLSELLEGLKQIDPEEWEIIMHGIPLTPMSQYFTFDHGETTAHRYHSTYLPFSQMERDVALVWLQGCLQRACEMREWDLRQDQWVIKMDGQNVVYHYATIEKGIAETGEPFEHEGRGKSQAEALLAAYVAAAKKEQSSCQEFDTPILVDHPRYDDHRKSIPRHSTVFFNICEGEKR